MKFTILTLFPDFFTSPFESSILKRAQSTHLNTKPPIVISTIQIRDFATDKHHTTDDHPYGGGPGMVMKIEPIDLALQSVKKHSPPRSRTILTSAKGELFTQQKAVEYSQYDELIIICGHYEGVDERVREHLVDDEVRIGDFVMTGGEPAAIVIVDAVARLLPDVLGNELSAVQESHSEPGYFEHPQYTRPEVYKGWKVPEVLLSGNHSKIKEWQQEQAKNNK
jgi:tRNA (guanine37-N1)-methyltransferase